MVLENKIKLECDFSDSLEYIGLLKVMRIRPISIKYIVIINLALDNSWVNVLETSEESWPKHP